MKIIDLLNKINKGEEIPEKVKYEDTIFEYDKDRKEYIHKVDDWHSETLLFKITNEHTHFIQDLLKAEVEVIEENKEIEEKLDWEEIIGSVGKPVWDDKRKKWRVLDYYCREQNTFYVSFSDTNNREKFEEKELYFKEREEK